MRISTVSVRWLVLACALGVALPACDSSDKDDETEEEEESKSKKKKKKKKGKKKKKKKKGDDDDDDDDDAKAAKPLPVDFIGDGFVVPAGGLFKAHKMDLGKKEITIKNYTYKPLDKYPRDKLHADFKKNLEDAGWSVTKESSGYSCTKGSKTVSVMFGENNPGETKINFL